jgi:DNA invertase Pin-like site-specific DNA recombinase
MMKIIGYIRVSTAKQAQEGLSLEAQKARIVQYARDNSMEIVRIECDAGLSAKSILARPGLSRALDQLQNGAADGILVLKLDRLTRSVVDLGHLIEKYFKKYNLISINEQIDTTSAAGRLILNILVTVSQWEREMCGERTREVFEALRASGLPAGPTPFGWERFRTDQSGRDSIQPSQAEKASIECMASLRLGGMSYRDIAAYLQTNGHKPKRGDTWHASAVRKVLLRHENTVVR